MSEIKDFFQTLAMFFKDSKDNKEQENAKRLAEDVRKNVMERLDKYNNDYKKVPNDVKGGGNRQYPNQQPKEKQEIMGKLYEDERYR